MTMTLCDYDVGAAVRQHPAPWPHLYERCDMTKATCSIDGCTRPVHGRGWCVRHYNRWRRNGDPVGIRAERGQGLDWLRQQVAEADRGECWAWPFGKSHYGYGVPVLLDGKKMRPHVAACALDGRPIPHGLVARHLCPGGSDPSCCNPDHIAAGTQKQNAEDAVAEGRIRHGEGHPQARLTRRDVVEIRALLAAGMLQHHVAKRFGVHDGAIAGIREGRTWKHVGEGGAR